MSIRRQFGSGVAWMAVGNWIEQGINFVVFVVLARILGAESYGLLAMAATLVLMSEALVRESFSDFLIAARAPEPGHYNAAFWLLAGLGGLLALALFLGARPIAAVYGEKQVVHLLRVLSATVAMISLSAIPVAILRRDLRFRVLGIRAVAGVASGGAVAIAMALTGHGVWSLVAQRLVQVFVNIAIAWATVSWRPGLRLTRRQLRDVFAFGGTVLGLRGAEIAVVQLPMMIVGATQGAAALGLFSVAWRVVEIGSFLIVTPLRLVAQPAFASMRRKGGDVGKLLLRITSLSGLVAFAAFAGLSVLSHEVIFLMFRTRWEPAAPLLSILALLGAYLCVEKIHQSFCLAAGRATATALLSWAEVAVVSFAVWALRDHDARGMALGMVAGLGAMWWFRFRVLAAIAGIGVRVLIGQYVVPLIGAAIMAGVVRAVLAWLPFSNASLRLLVGTLAGGAFYAAYGLLFMSERLALLMRFAARMAKRGEALERETGQAK